MQTKKARLIICLIVVAAIFGGNFIYNFFKGNNSSKNNIANQKQISSQNISEVPVKISEKILASDFDIYVPANVTFKNKDNVYIRIAYNGKVKNKVFKI